MKYFALHTLYFSPTSSTMDPAALGPELNNDELPIKIEYSLKDLDNMDLKRLPDCLNELVDEEICMILEHAEANFKPIHISNSEEVTLISDNENDEMIGNPITNHKRSYSSRLDASLTYDNEICSEAAQKRFLQSCSKNSEENNSTYYDENCSVLGNVDVISRSSCFSTEYAETDTDGEDADCELSDIEEFDERKKVYYIRYFKKELYEYELNET